MNFRHTLVFNIASVSQLVHGFKILLKIIKKQPNFKNYGHFWWFKKPLNFIGIELPPQNVVDKNLHQRNIHVRVTSKFCERL